MSNGPIDLPQVTIQHDFHNVMDDVRDNITTGEDVWLSCYKAGMTSLHAKLGVKKDDGVVDLVPRDQGLEVIKISSVRSWVAVFNTGKTELGLLDDVFGFVFAAFYL
jgi:hypothetical protein